MRPIFSLLLGLTVCLGLTSFVLYRAEEFGKAGYYADSLQGRKTASGEKYDKAELTCAHKTYAFGTKVRVTRLDNKKSVIVRVNDRGPYTEGFVVDLSRAAAEEIDLVKAGRANVKVELVEDEKDNKTELKQSSVPSPTSTASASTEKAAPATAGSSTLAKPRTQLLKAQQKGVKVTQPVTYSTEDPAPVTAATAQKSKTAATEKAPTEKAATAKTANPSELYKVDMRSAAKTGFGIQISTMYDADNVMPVVTKLQTQYPGKVLVSVIRDDANNQSTYRIIVGPFATRKAAEDQQKLAEKKNKGCFVIDLSGI